MYARDFSEGFGVRPLAPIEAIILIYCDGTKTQAEVFAYARWWAEKYQLQEKDWENLKLLIAGFIRDKVLLKVSGPPAELPAYNINDFLTARIPEPPPITRLEVPIGYGLILTQKCRFHCKYCYAQTVALNRQEALISLPRLKEIFSETRELGIESIAISGGEPFLHPQIFEVIAELVNTGISPAVSTKTPFSEPMIVRLVNTGLKRIQISLDSPNSEVVDNIVGVPGYFRSIVKTIEKLVAYGIKVRVNCVLIKETVKDVYALCELLYRLGVRQVSFAPFSANLAHYDLALFPAQNDYGQVSVELARAQQDFPGLLVHYSHPLELEEKLRKMEVEWCSAGRFGFAVRPDGKVTICEQLTDDDFVVGDLNHQSIIEVWYSEKMTAFRFPKRDYFKGTDCFLCDEFDECTKSRGRCYLRALLCFKRIYAPDPFCPRLQNRIVFKQW